jgi:hypothetical protein
VLRPAGPVAAPAPVSEPPAVPATAIAAAPEGESAAEPGDRADEGPVHRTLIRATLPRVEGEVPARPIPTFTAHEAANTRGRFRRFRPNGGGPRGTGNNGARPFGVMSSGKPLFGSQPNRGAGPKGGGHHPQRVGQQMGRKNQARRGGNKGR